MLNTIVVGICDINIRRHFVGIWHTFESAKMQLKRDFEIREEDVHAAHDDEGWTYPEIIAPMNPRRMWNAVIKDGHEECDFHGTLTEGGFSLYEVETSLGFVGYEED